MAPLALSLLASLTAALALAAVPLKPCPPTNVSTGHANCLATETCCTEQYFGASGCEVLLPTGKTTCCAPGPPLNISTTLPNCLIIGELLALCCAPPRAPLGCPDSLLAPPQTPTP